MNNAKVLGTVLCILAISSPLQAKSHDRRSDELKVQRMAAEWENELSEGQIDTLKTLLENSDLLSESKLEEATINALGQLILACEKNSEFQENLLVGRNFLFQRIGIDVDPRGFATLRDLVSRQHNQAQAYGSLKLDAPGSEDPKRVRSIQRARRYIGIFERANDPTNSKPFASASIPLAMREPRYPTLPDVRKELNALYVLDQQERTIDQRTMDEESRNASDKRMAANDEVVVGRFKKIFDKYGIPNNEEVGRSGTLAAWAIVHHAGITSPEMVHKASAEMRALFLNGELADGPYALFVDRAACVVEHKEQTYGTFPVGSPSDPYYCPIADPLNLNARRASVLFEPKVEASAEGTK